MTHFRVWYMRPESFGTYLHGSETPTIAGLAQTHVMLRSFKAEDLDAVYYEQQAFNWAQDWKATNRLLDEKGLRHTSMSVGDVIEDLLGCEYWVVRPAGFEVIQ